MTDRTMSKFGKILRRSTGDLFDLQIGTYVSCSKCLMFDSAQVVTQPKEQDKEVETGGVQYTPHSYLHSKARKLLIGLYKNQTVGSFLVLYNDDGVDGGGCEKKKTPRNIVWLKKGCIVTKGGDGGSHDSNCLTLHCSEVGDVKCTFDCSSKRKKWYKHIKNELNSHHSNSNNDDNDNNNNAVSPSIRNNADRIFTIEKQGCLRQCSKRSSSEQSRLAADLREMFIGSTYF